MRWDVSLIILAALAAPAGLPEVGRAAAGVGPGALDDPLARIHFVGGSRIVGDTNAVALNDFLAMPAFVQLKEQTLAKLAHAPFALLQARTAPGSSDYASFFRPLLDDLLSQESFLELWGTTGAFPELFFAIHLSDARAQLWTSSLAKVASAWTMVPARPIEVQGFKGWELKKHHPPNLLRVFRTADWLVLGLGQDELSWQAAMLNRIKETKRPIAPATNYWLSALVDGTRLASLFPMLGEFKLPLTRLTFHGTGKDLVAKASLVFPEPLSWKPEPWGVPTNTIRGPLMSFTSVQGIGPGLGRLKTLQTYKWDPVPNQFYMWTSAENPLQSYLAFPVENATNLLERLSPKIASALNTNLHRAMAGAINWHSKDHELTWEGLPFLAPFLRPTQEAGRQYLVAGLVRGAARRDDSVPQPSPILALTNQAYFDWENTSASLARWRTLSLLLLPLARWPLMNSDAAAAKWLQAIQPKLGNTTTQVVQTSPDQLDLARGGMPGLTGIELVALANWLEATNFPWLGYQVRGHGALSRERN